MSWLLSELLWLPVRFWVQLRLLTLIYKKTFMAWTSQVSLSPTFSAQLVHSRRVCMFQVPSIKYGHLTELRKCAFSIVTIAFWNSIPPKSEDSKEWAPSLLGLPQTQDLALVSGLRLMSLWGLWFGLVSYCLIVLV